MAEPLRHRQTKDPMRVDSSLLSEAEWSCSTITSKKVQGGEKETCLSDSGQCNLG